MSVTNWLYLNTESSPTLQYFNHSSTEEKTVVDSWVHLLGCYQLTCLLLLKPDTGNCGHERRMPGVYFLIYRCKVFCLFSVWLEVISSSTPFKLRSASSLQHGLGLGSGLCPFGLSNISEDGNSTPSLVILCNREPAVMFNYLPEKDFFLVSNCQNASWARQSLGQGTRGSLESIRAGHGSQGLSHRSRQEWDRQAAPGESQSWTSGTSLETGTGENQAGP